MGSIIVVIIEIYNMSWYHYFCFNIKDFMNFIFLLYMHKEMKV